jgi:predicted amidophosphoribosyltransferase
MRQKYCARCHAKIAPGEKYCDPCKLEEAEDEILIEIWETFYKKEKDEHRRIMD